MTPAQVRIIRAGFAQMEPTLPNLGHKYYGRVFAKAPELRALLEGQEEKLAKAVCALIRRRASMALPALGDAAAGRPVEQASRERGVELPPEYLAIMRGALIELVRDELGGQLSKPAEEAWGAAFEVLSQTMLAGVGNVATADDRFFSRLPEEGKGEASAAPASGEAALQRFFS